MLQPLCDVALCCNRLCDVATRTALTARRLNNRSVYNERCSLPAVLRGTLQRVVPMREPMPCRTLHTSCCTFHVAFHAPPCHAPPCQRAAFCAARYAACCLLKACRMLHGRHVACCVHLHRWLARSRLRDFSRPRANAQELPANARGSQPRAAADRKQEPNMRPCSSIQHAQDAALWLPRASWQPRRKCGSCVTTISLPYLPQALMP